MLIDYIQKTMKKALKGVSSIRAGVYKKVDVAVSKNVGAAVEEAVINVVNGYLDKVKAKKPRRKKKSAE